ncbi:MAG: hypothetical protein IKC46_12450 [Lachnospiraceae bacterium]|nr:hypothetical protein [Lachnospiraceae bacterium]
MKEYIAKALANAPVLEADNKVLVDAWNLALHTLLNISTVECPMEEYNKTGLLEENPGLMIRAGGTYPTPWTRDAAINTMNAACFLEPEVAKNTLWAVCERVDGKLCFQMDKQSWDKIVWAIGAWYYYLTSGDTEFLALAYETVSNSVSQLEEMQFNTEYGLFCGGSFFNDGITGYPKNLHEEGNNASFVKKHPATAGIMTLSTNCLYYKAYLILADMVRILKKDPAEKEIYLQKADTLKASVNNYLWSDKLGRYGYFIYPDGTLDESQEGCGLSFAVLYGVCDGEKADRILENIHVNKLGLVSIWPPFEGLSSVEMPVRHNNLIWPFVNGFFADMAAKKGRGDLAGEEILHMAKLALATKGFYEIYNPETGEPDGGWQIGIHWESVPDQTWSATGFIRMIVYALCGVELAEEGIYFRPCLPEGFGSICLKGLKVRGLDMTLIVRSKDESGRKILINGQPGEKICYCKPGTYVVEMWI